MKVERSFSRCITLGDNEPLDIQELQGQNSNESGLIIQIYAHGGEPGIAHTPTSPIISWQEVIQRVSECRTNFPVRLDLLGICESKYIVQHLNTHSTIDQIWINTELTFWQSVYNGSRMCITFEMLLNDISEDEETARFRPNYREINWG